MATWPLLVLLVGAAPAATVEVDLSTPLRTLQSIVLADEARDREAAAQCLIPEYRDQVQGVYGIAGQAWQFSQWFRSRLGRVLRYEPGQISQWDDLARGLIKVTLPVPIGRNKRDIYFWFTLRRVGDEWLEDPDPRPALLRATDDWLTAQSEHIVYHFTQPDAISAEVMAYHERFYDEVCTLMEVRPTEKVHYFYAASEEEADFIGCPPWEAAGEGSMYTVVATRPRFAHEICHAMLPQQPPNNVLSEGLAVYLADNRDRQAIVPVRWRAEAGRLLQEGKLYPLSELATRDLRAIVMDADVVFDVLYPQSAAFVQWLIEERGIERFRRLFAEANIANFQQVFAGVYDQELAAAEEDWQEWVAQ
jgi:hypothetical protein